MAYNVNMVLLPNVGTAVIKGAGLAGFPSGGFNYLLFSEWVCLGTLSRSVGVYNNITFFQVVTTNSTIQIILLAGVSNPVFNGLFTVPIGNYRSNVLVSADPTTQTLQVYVNDIPAVLTSGGWSGSGQFDIATSVASWSVSGAGSAAPGAGIGDLFVAPPVAFYDLSVTANRRKFIATDLTPVDLLVDGSEPLGSPPPVYLTGRSGTANDFRNNNGTGGPFNFTLTPDLTFQADGTCVVLPVITPARPFVMRPSR